MTVVGTQGNKHQRERQQLSEGFEKKIEQKLNIWQTEVVTSGIKLRRKERRYRERAQEIDRGKQGEG